MAATLPACQFRVQLINGVLGRATTMCTIPVANMHTTTCWTRYNPITYWLQCVYAQCAVHPVVTATTSLNLHCCAILPCMHGQHSSVHAHTLAQGRLCICVVALQHAHTSTLPHLTLRQTIPVACLMLLAWAGAFSSCGCTQVGHASASRK
jgi:hypothetical protein